VYHQEWYAIGVPLGERVLVLRVLFVLAAFVVLYGCTQTSSPVENKEQQGGVKQEGRRTGDEQADPERAAQPSKVDDNKETQSPREVKKKQPGAAVEQQPPNTANEEMGHGASGSTVRVFPAVDGDTIEVTPRVDGREQVRLIGVDAPEVGQPHAQEAR
jgi:endonuclease YncB( thermonuclease family)